MLRISSIVTEGLDYIVLLLAFSGGGAAICTGDVKIQALPVVAVKEPLAAVLTP